MHKTNPFKLTNATLFWPLLFTLSIWIVFWIEIKWHIHLKNWGIFPRQISGLRGILFGPFVHGDASHLWHNTLPLFILSFALFYFYRPNVTPTLFLGFFLTGFLTWCIGRPAYHIGASGIIYMLFGFLFLKGLVTRHINLIALSLFVVFVYGGMLWFVVPIDYKISWEGHLSGLLVGFVLALAQSDFKNTAPISNYKYAWEHPDYDESKDAFMRCFTSEGKFVSTSEAQVIEKSTREVQIATVTFSIRLLKKPIVEKKRYKNITSQFRRDDI